MDFFSQYRGKKLRINKQGTIKTVQRKQDAPLALLVSRRARSEGTEHRCCVEARGLTQ